VCAGVPTDTSEDYRQLSGIMAHLARWGFIVIAPDLSWLASQFSTNDWQLVIADAASYMFAANGSSGSPFQGQIKTASVSLMGHSSGGLAVTHEATAGTLTVDAVALLAPANVSHETVIANFAPKPVIVVFGTQDAGPFSVNGQALDTYHAAGAKKHLVTIGGADHFGYTDSLCFQADGPPTISQADQQKIAKAYLTAFFRRFLSGASEVQDYLTGARVVEELESFAITVEAQL
jgi:dienelactone hydrolase